MAAFATAALGLWQLAVAAAAAGQACAAGSQDAEASACSRQEAPLRLEKDHLLFQIDRGFVPLNAKSAGAVAAADKAKEPAEAAEAEAEAAAVAAARAVMEPAEEVELVEESPVADEAREQLEEEVEEEDEELVANEVGQNGTTDAAPSAQGQACEPWMITRRRRNDVMCSCRRRAAWENDLPSGWRCNEAQNRVEHDDNTPPPLPPHQGGEGVIGWSTSGAVKSGGLWCQVNVPPAGWHLKACPVSGGSTNIKVLTYNLFWWNLYGKRGGNGGSAGKKIADTSGPEKYDLMGFQECDHMSRIMDDAHAHGLDGDYELVNGGRALAIAWRKSRFTHLADGKGDVGEDHHSQYYGKRSAHWVRLQHNDGKTVFFLNHHGPLPVSKSGGCTGSSTAYNILKMIATNAHKNDVIIVVGDFNAQGHSSRVQAMKGYLNHVYSGTCMGGVDHIFSNCNAVSHHNLGKGGSDHDALNAIFRI